MKRGVPPTALNDRTGELTPPGDKSISHRLAMLGALAEGTSEFSNFLEGEDCLSTIAAFQKMGHLWGQRAELDQLIHREPMIGEFSDRDRRAFERQGRYDDVDAAAVG